MCAHAVSPILWLVPSVRHLSSRATVSQPDLYHRIHMRTHTHTQTHADWWQHSINRSHCLSLLFFFLLNLLFRLYCIFMFLLIHLGLFGIYVSFTQHPSLLNSLHLSLPGPLWQFVTLPPWGSHQFRWALYVTSQLCLFKPLADPLLHPASAPSSYLFLEFSFC